VAAGIGSNEQGEYCRAALQRSDRKEPRYKWPTLLYFTLHILSSHTLWLPANTQQSIHILTYAGQNTGQADDVESQAPHQKDTEHLLYDARCWRAS